MHDPNRKTSELDPMMLFGRGGWHSWGSPVALGAFFVLAALAVDLIRLALR